MTTQTGQLLRRAAPDAASTSRIGDYLAWLAREGIGEFGSYDELWRWSVSDLDAFWESIWRYFDLGPADGPVLAVDALPGAVWFPDRTVNYAETVLRMPGRAPDDVVVVAESQTRPPVTYTAAQLRDAVGRAQEGLRRAGIGRGDRVAAYAPNVPETMVLLLAAAGLGAVFTSCAPEFGTDSVVDRWSQVGPRFLLAVDGYRYGSRAVDRREQVRQIRERVSSIETVVRLPYLDASWDAGDDSTWSAFTAVAAEPSFVPTAFADPLYVLYSSGTTGLPKPIVHGHGGITLEHLKALALHLDVGPGDRFFWFTTTGWMMWNLLVSAPLVGAAVVMFDGDPGSPDVAELWRLAERTGLTYFGTSATFVQQNLKQGVEPRQGRGLDAVRAVGVTGSPLSPDGFRWVLDALGSRVQLTSLAGGTDVCTGFLGGTPLHDVHAGLIACRQLGCAVESFDPSGRPLVGEVGELVVTRPMPSMPVGFWNDPDGERLRAAYFDTFPGVWRHGDWLTIDAAGRCSLTGRSDATLNRGGVRLGTAEFYAVVEAVDGVTDSLVVHLEDPDGGAGRLLLFVVAVPASGVDDEIRAALRSKLSPRHVPDEILHVAALPRTLSGKKVEVPVKRILTGTPLERAVAPGSLADPAALEHVLAAVRV
ncbi:acetoacetate--CoA ligase [Spongisporangium articulatum]|uniref:Acetoacetate--CoA ligase n=1 Tax=Spongisporangium articulatum TaxID=3362603 RepID=A0ABW8AV78_9ACTN